MKQYLLDLLIFLCLGVSLTFNFYLLQKYNQNLQYKERVLELIVKRNNTVSLAKESLYTDSIYNIVNDWLKNETSK